jgi:3-deoxy-7-phosphoheptulonate synthase
MGDIIRELETSVAIHQEHRSRLGGVHLEMTGDNVTECTGAGVTPDQVPARYESYCDPRLNAAQSMELAMQLSRVLSDTLS